MAGRAEIERLRSRIAEVVGRHGWAVQAVLPGARPVTPSFAYTVGLAETFRHPEILMVGFEPEMMTHILNEAGERIREGMRFADWDRCDRIVRGFPVWFREIHQDEARSWAKAASERSRTRSAPFGLLQMFLPDPAGLFPWDEGCDRAYVGMQGGIRKAERLKG